MCHPVSERHIWTTLLPNGPKRFLSQPVGLWRFQLQYKLWLLFLTARLRQSEDESTKCRHLFDQMWMRKFVQEMGIQVGTEDAVWVFHATLSLHFLVMIVVRPGLLCTPLGQIATKKSARGRARILTWLILISPFIRSLSNMVKCQLDSHDSAGFECQPRAQKRVSVATRFNGS